MTGARHRNGTLRCETAASVARYLGIRDLKEGEERMVEDKGIFDAFDAVDMYQNRRRCHGTINVPLRILRQMGKLMEGK
jgi:hypothetical protein